MKKLCIEADLVLILVPQLKSTDEEMLLHTGRAIGRICYEKSKSYSVNTKGILCFLANVTIYVPPLSI